MMLGRTEPIYLFNLCILYKMYNELINYIYCATCTLAKVEFSPSRIPFPIFSFGCPHRYSTGSVIHTSLPHFTLPMESTVDLLFVAEILLVQVCDFVAGQSTVTTITNNILESVDYAYINKYTYRLRWAVMMT
jgi:hypothetical protein